VHEAFDLSGSVAISHLASLQAEQVLTYIKQKNFFADFLFFRRLKFGPKSSLMMKSNMFWITRRKQLQTGET
jgi:hypothetical protein